MPTAGILIIGNEILSGKVVDTNSPYLCEQLRELGVDVERIVTIPDGYTIVVGGMEIESSAEAISQIPLLADIPLIGELFKNRSRSTTRSRFYVFIRANVLRHDGFEDLKYLSDRDVLAADVDDGWPVVKPRVIH